MCSDAHSITLTKTLLLCRLCRFTWNVHELSFDILRNQLRNGLTFKV